MAYTPTTMQLSKTVKTDLIPIVTETVNALPPLPTLREFITSKRRRERIRPNVGAHDVHAEANPAVRADYRTHREPAVAVNPALELTWRPLKEGTSCSWLPKPAIRT